MSAQVDAATATRLHHYWLDRARGELTTALAFEHIRDDLVDLGAPSTLVDLTTTIIADEHRHADWCLATARAMRPDLTAEHRLRGTQRGGVPGATDDDNRILRTVFGSCFSETIAVHVLSRSHAAITDPTVRQLNHRHLREEVRHAQLGWAFLAWDGLTRRDRTMIAHHLPAMEAFARELWTSVDREPEPHLERLGYLSNDIVRAGIDAAVTEVIRPGFTHHEIGA